MLAFYLQGNSFVSNSLLKFCGTSSSDVVLNLLIKIIKKRL